MNAGKLNGRTALITGGGSGIGRAVARRFLDEGCRVAITGRKENKLRDVWNESGRDARLSFRASDVADFDAVRAMVDWAAKELKQIDILVNNAGLNIKNRGFRELTPESWRQVIQTNLDGAFYCIHAVLPQMLQRRDGLIINISSTAGKRAMPLSGAAYAASKFGMSALGLCLGIEEKDSNIRCSNIYPGEVDTPILEARPQPISDEHRRRILHPEDVAEAVLFVATLPPHVTVPELIIKPACQAYA